jgi:hypothetical protein
MKCCFSVCGHQSDPQLLSSFREHAAQNHVQIIAKNQAGISVPLGERQPINLACRCTWLWKRLCALDDSQWPIYLRLCIRVG